LHPSNLAKRGTVLLFLALIAFYLYGLGHFPLLGPDEPRYAQVAREMFLRHDLITPTLGAHTWFEKPVLLYWMMIVSFKLFGISEWTARLPAAVSGLLTIAAVYSIARCVERNDGGETLAAYSFWSALASATTLGIIVFSRAASFDIVLTMTTTWALAFYLLYEFERNEKLRGVFIAGFYTFIGLSLLAKGLVGIVIPVGVVGFYYLLQRRLPGRTKVISLFWGIPLTLIVAAAWYAPVIRLHGWTFINQFFIEHHFARYVSDKYHHPAPVYYYLLIFLALTLPWTAFVIEGIVTTGRRLWRRDELLRPHPVDRFRVFTIAWVLLPLLFFSFSSSKLPGYILPVFPAAALIAGERLARLNRRPGSSKLAIRLTAGLCLLVAVAVVMYMGRSGNLSVRCAALIIAPLTVAGGFGLLWTKRGSAFVMMTAGLVLVTMLLVFNCGVEKLVEHQSTRQLLQLADVRGYSQTPVFGLQRDDRSPEFYAAGRVVYDAEGEPRMYEGVGQIVSESRSRKATILTLVPVKEVTEFTQLSSVRVDVIGNNTKVALVAVGPP
jgi:4-amino-4-deoxy-L-arabinose transferase-like glycosyltransferase